MSAFSAIVRAKSPKRVAPRIVELPPSAFADEWSGKPTAALAVGLRLVSERDMQTARSEAAKRAWELHREERDDENRVDAFNDALMHWTVSCALCQPDDVSRPFWDAQHEVVDMALTSEGVRLLWEELESLHLESSPLGREVDDDELPALGALTPEALDALDAITARRVRRLLAHCLDTIAES